VSTNAIKYRKLRGHKGSVLCMSKMSTSNGDNSSSVFCSGGEDSTVRVWDLRMNSSRSSQSAVMCIAGVFDGEDVTSVATLSSAADKDGGDVLYASAGKKVYSFDLRKATMAMKGKQSAGPLIRECDAFWEFNADEINQLAVRGAFDSSEGVSVASCDDSGCAALVTHTIEKTNNNASNDSASTSTATATQKHVSKLEKMIAYGSSSDVMITACAFRPNANGTSGFSTDLITGTTSCVVSLWDGSSRGGRRVKNAVSECNMGDGMRAAVTSGGEGGESESRNQVCNPPFVNSVAWDSTGKVLAAGCGDGAISLFSIEGGGRKSKQKSKSLNEWRRIIAHGSAVAFVHFDDDDVLISAGNDLKIAVHGKINKEDDDENNEEAKIAAKIAGIDHGEKMNCLLSVNDSSFEEGGEISSGRKKSLAVGDVTNDITLYEMEL
jgi:WD40 repeat protein